MRSPCTKCMAPATRNSPSKTQYALAILKGRQKGKQYEWWVDDVRFPYTPQELCAGRRRPPTTVTATHTDGHETTASRLEAREGSAITAVRQASALALFRVGFAATRLQVFEE